jgi:surfeit locus 1 family protein
MKLSLRPLFWPTLISLPALVLAMGLGAWQMERREWKRDILDRIAANQAAPALPFGELLKGDPLAREYGKARIAGTFLNDHEFYLAARSLKDDVGLHVITPVRTDAGQIVLFDRGFVPSGKKDPASRAASRVDGPVDLVGVVRRSQKKPYFVPDNDPAKNFWFTVDVPAMRKLAGGAPDPVLDAFFLEADATPNPGGIPRGGQTYLDIPNDHLQYAITWFLIGLTLVGVYLVYHWQNGRLAIDGRTSKGAER